MILRIVLLLSSVLIAAAGASSLPDDQTALAASFMQKLRETGDGAYLDKASSIISQVLASDPSNYEAQRLHIEVDLQLHRFASVAEQSRKLAAIKPKDPRNFGTLGDALMEMGEYDAAADAYQKMVNLRPGLASLNRVAFYRFVTGDAAGAIAAMEKAVATGGRNPENLAWCLVDLGSMYFKTGKLQQAGESDAKALAIFPGYYRAYAGLGQVLAAAGRTADAIAAYKRAQESVPLPDYAAALAELYAASGNPAEARKQRDLIDFLDKMGQMRGETTNRNLALVYANQNRRLDRALELAQAELASRRDVYTYDALAWVLFKNGRCAEAQEAMQKAMRLDTPEPSFARHARSITTACSSSSSAPSKK